MEQRKVMGLLAIILTAFMWGLSFLSIKISVDVLAPMTLALSRFVIASIILRIVLKLAEPQTALAKKDYPLMAVAGIVGVTLYFYFENNGVKYTTASAASLIIATIPILTLVADYIFCGNKLSPVKILSVALSTVGVYLIVAVDQVDGGNLRGNLLMFGAALAWVVYTLVTRPLSEKYSQLAVVTYQTLFGTVALLPFSLMETTHWQQVNTTIILNVVFLGVFCSALGYYLYVYAMDTLGISTVSLFINLIPVVAVAAGYFVLKEPVSLSQIIGGCVIIFSVYLASGQNKNISVPVTVSESKPL